MAYLGGGRGNGWIAPPPPSQNFLAMMFATEKKKSVLLWKIVVNISYIYRYIIFI